MCELLGQPSQEGVPWDMAERVVVRLEPVEVEERKCEPLPLRRLVEGGGKIVHQLTSVRETGEAVGMSRDL